jgi:hypothetical protein
VVIVINYVVTGLTIEKKLSDELTAEFYSQLSENLQKAKLIRFRDERGISAVATDYIKHKEKIAGIAIFKLSSFDSYPWYDVYKEENSFFQLTVRLAYERFARFDYDDPNNWYVHTLQNEVSSVLLWTNDQKEFLHVVNERPIEHKYMIPFHESFVKYVEKGKKHGLTKQCPSCFTFDAYTWAFLMVSQRSFD